MASALQVDFLPFLKVRYICYTIVFPLCKPNRVQAESSSTAGAILSASICCLLLNDSVCIPDGKKSPSGSPFVRGRDLRSLNLMLSDLSVLVYL